MVSVKFEKMDNGTLRCRLTRKDLTTNGIDIEDFFSNTQNARDFLEKLIRMAEDEVGFKASGNMMSIQAAIMSEDDIVLTFSESRASSAEIIDSIRKMVTEQKEKGKNLIAKDLFEELGKTNLQAKKTEEIKNEEQEYRYMVTFETLTQAILFSKAIQFEVQQKENVISELYSIKGKIYLHADLGQLAKKQIYEFVAAAMEYAVLIEKETNFLAYLKEHGKTICNTQALQILSNL